MRHIESRLQQQCVQWFRWQYPDIAPLLFAVPNGGKRTPTEAKILQAEGVTPGVSDLILLLPSNEYHALCIEMKTAKGRQTERQKSWEMKARAHGNAYRLCRSLEEFREVVNGYLRER